MDSRFLNAFIDPGVPFRLLGRTLYPWCLKYRLRLHAFKSPLVDGHRPVTPADLIFACQVCAEEPLGEIGVIDRLRLMRLNANPAKFEMLLNAFAGYILIDNWPKFWEQSKARSGSGTKGVPWILSTIGVLIKSGIEEKRAWEMPECQAIWYSATFAMHSGADVAIMSPEEQAFIESELKKEEETAKAVANPAGMNND